MGCKKDDSTDKIVPETTKFMIISDIHYFDPSLFTIPVNPYFQGYIAADRKLISYYMLNAPPYNIPGATISALQLDRIMANVMVAHYAGDESPFDNRDVTTSMISHCSKMFLNSCRLTLAILRHLAVS
jgi:hypothetical protein